MSDSNRYTNDKRLARCEHGWVSGPGCEACKAGEALTDRERDIIRHSLTGDIAETNGQSGSAEISPRYAWVATGFNEMGYFQHIIQVKRKRLGWCLLLCDSEHTAELTRPEAVAYRTKTGHEVRLVKLTPTTLAVLK